MFFEEIGHMVDGLDAFFIFGGVTDGEDVVEFVVGVDAEVVHFVFHAFAVEERLEFRGRVVNEVLGAGDHIGRGERAEIEDIFQLDIFFIGGFFHTALAENAGDKVFCNADLVVEHTAYKAGGFDGKVGFIHAEYLLKFFARGDKARISGKETAAAVTRQEDGVFVANGVGIDIFPDPFERSHSVFDMSGEDVFRRKRIADVDDDETAFYKVVAIVLVQFLVAVHQTAAVHIDDDGQFFFRAFGEVDIE